MSEKILDRQPHPAVVSDPGYFLGVRRSGPGARNTPITASALRNGKVNLIPDGSWLKNAPLMRAAQSGDEEAVDGAA